MLFVFSLSSPEFVPFFCSLFLLLFLWGAEANTTVFLYINSCTLNTIQLLTKLNLCGLVFSFPVDLQLLTKRLSGCFFLQTFAFFCFLCSFPSFLALCVVLFHISSHADALTGMADFFFSILVVMMLSATVHLHDEAFMIIYVFLCVTQWSLNDLSDILFHYIVFILFAAGQCGLILMSCLRGKWIWVYFRALTISRLIANHFDNWFILFLHLLFRSSSLWLINELIVKIIGRSIS